MTAIDKLVYLAVIVGPVMTFPQLLLVIQGKTDTSILTWGGYFFISVIWLAYGLKHKDKPIIIVQTSYVLLDGAIVIGLLRS